MYEFINGVVEKIHPQYIVVMTAGIGYKLITANPYRYQEQLAKTVSVPVELVVREDAMTLYGFWDEQEKELFHKLIKVSGIGPKSALAILALNDHEGLIHAIDNSDSTYLTKFPGVGKKTAQQMILDLKGEIQLTGSEAMVTDKEQTTGQVSFVDEVMEALEGLGYTRREIQKIKPALKAQSFASTQEGLSFAFKLLIKA